MCELRANLHHLKKCTTSFMPVADAAGCHSRGGCTCHHYSANYIKQDQNFLYVLIKQRMQVIKIQILFNCDAYETKERQKYVRCRRNKLCVALRTFVRVKKKKKKKKNIIF